MDLIDLLEREMERDPRYLEDKECGAFGIPYQVCLHEQFKEGNPDHQGPVMISCPCPKCSIRC